MGEYRIVREPSAIIRQIARQALKDNWFKLTVGMFIIYLLTTGISSILSDFAGMTKVFEFSGVEYTLRISFPSGLYALLVTGPLSLGTALYLITFFRTRNENKSLIFEGFGFFGKSLLVYIIMTIKVFLWSLLFVIPGIVAAFRYSMSFYALAEDPKRSAFECINESKRIMNGNKSKLFWLQLSFIGWYFIAGIPVAIITALISEGVPAVITSLIAGIPTVVVDLYSTMSIVVMYELATGKISLDTNAYANSGNSNSNNGGM